MPDVPWEKLRELAAEIKRRNGVYWLKFTCCGVRQDVEPPDVMHTRAVCEVCRQVYDFKKRGGGLRGAWMMGRRGPPAPPAPGY